MALFGTQGARPRRTGWWAIAPITLLVLALLPAHAASGIAGSTSPCGPTPPFRPGGGTWVCTFDDEFNDTAIDGTKWYTVLTSYTGFHSGAECMTNDPNNLSEGGGVLSLTVRKEAAPFTCTTPTGGYETQYTGATVDTLDRFSQAYGRFEIRAKFPAATVPGLQASLWMMATGNKYGNWPTNGEIDAAEEYSQYSDRAIPYVHYTSAIKDTHVTNTNCKITRGAFHTYVVIWTTSAITVLFDGRTCISDSWQPAAPLVKPEPFDQPFIVALTQALGVGTNAVTDATVLPATTQIDYVRVWS
jgi:beta-glucanase (GH16 family)